MASRIFLGYLFGEQNTYTDGCDDIREYSKEDYVSPIIAKGNKFEGIEAIY